MPSPDRNLDFGGDILVPNVLRAQSEPGPDARSSSSSSSDPSESPTADGGNDMGGFSACSAFEGSVPNLDAIMLA